MFGRLRNVLEMIRFSHTLFALPFALMAALMAWSLDARAIPPIPFRGQQLVGILVCMVMARSAAMAFNRLVDRKIDAENPRTASRHLSTGLLSVRSVVSFAIVCSVGFVAGTLMFLPNMLPLELSLPVLAFLLGYSYTKRFSSYSHFWLGAALMLAPVSAWIAIRGRTVIAMPGDLLPALVLGGAVLLWVAGFDLIYACQDADFDRRTGLFSVPARLGIPAALKMAALCHLGMLAFLIVLPCVYPRLGWIYWWGVGAVALLLLYEHAITRPENLKRVNVAFFQVNIVVSMGLLLVVALDLYW